MKTNFHINAKRQCGKYAVERIVYIAVIEVKYPDGASQEQKSKSLFCTELL